MIKNRKENIIIKNKNIDNKSIFDNIGISFVYGISIWIIFIASSLAITIIQNLTEAEGLAVLLAVMWFLWIPMFSMFFWIVNLVVKKDFYAFITSINLILIGLLFLSVSRLYIPIVILISIVLLIGRYIIVNLFYLLKE